MTVSKKCLLLLPFWCWVTVLESLSARSLVCQHHTRLQLCFWQGLDTFVAAHTLPAASATKFKLHNSSGLKARLEGFVLAVQSLHAQP